jgi:hypothetical protein
MIALPDRFLAIYENISYRGIGELKVSRSKMLLKARLGLTNPERSADLSIRRERFRGIFDLLKVTHVTQSVHESPLL